MQHKIVSLGVSMGLLLAPWAVRASDIEVYQAREIKPHVAQPVEPARPAREREPAPPHERSGREAADVDAAVEQLIGVWQTRVPGAVWQAPSEVAGRDRLRVSAGANGGDLAISPDGRYAWNAYGGKIGVWVRGDTDYPVVLIDAAEGKRWKVGYDPRHTGGRDIVVWDGAVAYDGRRK